MKNTSDFYRLIIRNIIRIGLPVAVQSMLVALLSLTDVVMVSPFGKESAAAVGVASKWHFLLIMIMSGIAQASGIIIAQFAGKKDFKSAKMIFRKSVYTGMLIFIIPVLLLTFIPQYFLMLQTDDELVIANGCIYLFWCSVIQLLTFYVIVCESALRSSGDGFTPLVFGAITIFLNIFFNYCLIGGNFGFEALGVKGAALATSIARILQFIMLITFFVARKHWLYTETAAELKDSVVKRLKNLSISCAISSVIYAIGSMVCQILIGKTGTAELAVYCILDPFLSLMYGFYYGLAVAASVTIGSLLGKKEFTDAKTVASGFLRMITLAGIITGFLLYTVKNPLIQLLNFNAEQYEMASYALNVVALVCTLCLINMILVCGILRAGGQNTYTLYCNLASSWCCVIPLMFATLYFGGSFKTIFPLLYSGELLGFILLYTGYKRGIWIKDLTE